MRNHYIMPPRLLAVALGVAISLPTILAVPNVAAQQQRQESDVEDINRRAQEFMASGVIIRIKAGENITAPELARRHKVHFDKVSPWLFGQIKLERKVLVPLSVSAADAERLRSDPAIESASADFVIHTTIVHHAPPTTKTDSTLAAHAGWEKLSEYGGMRLYVDPSTLRELPQDSRRAWILLDSDRENEAGDRSHRMLVETNCATTQFRFLQKSFFKGEMASGPASYTSNESDEWAYAAPGTLADAIVKFTCI